MFGAFLHPVTAAGGAEVERESAEMSQDVDLVGDRALRRVPTGFDPASIAQSVLIEDWSIQKLSAPKCEVIVCTVSHHPHPAHGRRIQ